MELVVRERKCFERRILNDVEVVKIVALCTERNRKYLHVCVEILEARETSKYESIC